MPTLRIEASVEQLLEAVSQLSPDEILSFSEKVVALRAKHIAPHVDQDETELLLRINQTIPPNTKARYKTLSAKRDEETLTQAEYDELLAITEQIELQEVDSRTHLPT